MISLQQLELRLFLFISALFLSQIINQLPAPQLHGRCCCYYYDYGNDDDAHIHTHDQGNSNAPGQEPSCTLHHLLCAFWLALDKDCAYDNSNNNYHALYDDAARRHTVTLAST